MHYLQIFIRTFLTTIKDQLILHVRYSSNQYRNKRENVVSWPQDHGIMLFIRSFCVCDFRCKRFLLSCAYDIKWKHRGKHRMRTVEPTIKRRLLQLITLAHHPGTALAACKTEGYANTALLSKGKRRSLVAKSRR